MNTVKTELLHKEITRKQFLAIVAGAGLAFFGLNNFLSFITQVADSGTGRHIEAGRHGFGSSKFGV